MKITDVKTYIVANPPPHHGGPYFVFLKLTTDDKIGGFGEVYGVPFSPNKVRRLIEFVRIRARRQITPELSRVRLPAFMTKSHLNANAII